MGPTKKKLWIVSERLRERLKTPAGCRSATSRRKAISITSQSRSLIEIVLFACAMLFTWGASATAAQAIPDHPNIVLILSDDMGYGDPSSYGDKKILTPNLDQVASDGIKFTDAHSPSSVCTPTRYGLLTGRYAWRTWNGNRTLWSDDPLLVETDRLTLPKLLKKFQYRTAIIGKWHLGFGAPGTPGWDDLKGPNYNMTLEPGPLEVGFDYFFGIPHVGEDPYFYIENHHVVGLKADDPVQLVLDQNHKHSYLERTGEPDYHFTGGAAAKYKSDELGVELTSRAVKWIENQQQEPFFLYFAHRTPHAPIDPNPVFRNTSKIGPYGDFITELDWSVGEVVKALARKGFTDRTIVIIASDNGGVTDYAESVAEINGHRLNGQFFGQKGQVYEGGNRIPLIIKWPGVVSPGKTSDALVSLTDVVATVADMLKYDLPLNEAEDSFSFLHVLRATEATHPVRNDLILDSWNDVFGIREGEWKLIFGADGGGVKSESVQDPSVRRLYNLRSDPGERVNVYDSHPKLVACLSWHFREIQFNGRSRSLRDSGSPCKDDGNPVKADSNHGQADTKLPAPRSTPDYYW